MAKKMLDTPHYEVRTGGLWRTVLSIATRDLAISNWVILDKHSGTMYRLTEKEQDLIGHVAEHLAPLWLAPDFRQTKKDRRQQGDALLEDAVVAIVDARNGDRGKMDGLTAMGHAEFVEYATKLWGSQDQLESAS